MPGGVFCGMMVVPGGGARGCDCTAPGAGTPCPGSGRLGVGSRRPCVSSVTSSSSSGGGGWLPRGTLPGGRGAGSEKILPICACAGGASEIAVAANRAAKPVRAMVRNISRLQKANRARDIVQWYRHIRRSQGNRLTRRIRRGCDRTNFYSHFNESEGICSHSVPGFLIGFWYETG